MKEKISDCLSKELIEMNFPISTLFFFSSVSLYDQAINTDFKRELYMGGARILKIMHLIKTAIINLPGYLV